MLTSTHSWPRALRWVDGSSRPLMRLCSTCQRQFHRKVVIKENDVVILKRKGGDERSLILTKPLKITGQISTPRGFIETASIIGKGIRDIVLTNSNVAYRIHQPTLAEYVTFSPRLVTPIYPQNANLIVSLLDLHPPAGPNNPDDEPLEIFEAGTGHGSLTLHLARAIHGFNQLSPPIPSFEAPTQPLPINKLPEEAVSESSGESAISADQISQKSVSKTEELNAESKGGSSTQVVDQTAVKDVLDHMAVKRVYEAYLSTRRAIIQTLDISPKNSNHAARVIRQFRHGLYLPNINFHAGTVSGYISSRLSSRATTESNPFLAHAILDLPSPHEHFDLLSQALNTNGSLLVFCPNITQIIKCVQLVSEKRMPFLLETVLEVGAGMGSGGRKWDVKAVKPKAILRAELEAKAKAKARAEAGAETASDAAINEGDDVVLDGQGEEPRPVDANTESNCKANNGWEMICRPEAGQITVGGFIALWRRMSWEKELS